MEKKAISPSKAYKLLNHGPVVLVTSHDGRRANIMTVAWVTPLNWEPALIGVTIGEQAYTQQVIRETREFGINVPSVRLLKQVLYCGNSSGKKIDKFAESDLSPYPSRKIRPPLIRECLGGIECKVVETHQFGDAIMFVGEVVHAVVNTGVWNGSLRMELAAAKTLHHLGGERFTVDGKVI